MSLDVPALGSSTELFGENVHEGEPPPSPKSHIFLLVAKCTRAQIFVRITLGKIVPLPRCLMESGSGIIMIKNGGGYCLLGRAFY